jgi:phosphopantetheine adenylyltransferase
MKGTIMITLHQTRNAFESFFDTIFIDDSAKKSRVHSALLKLIRTMEKELTEQVEQMIKEK